MEFEEMRKIWDSQNNQTLYAIDETALSNRITARKNSARRTTNLSELVVIVTHFMATAILVIVIWMNKLNSVSMYLLTAWMFVTAVVSTVVRVSRIYSKVRFDLSMFGELGHAISLATHQVRFSNLMKWNSIPVAALAILVVWEGGKSIWIVIGMTVFFAGAYLASQWEHNFYKKKKYELEQLRVKLDEN
jgi:hypothetical protein